MADKYIFQNGQFSNTVAGFDLSDYKETVGGSISSLSQWLGSKYGLVVRSSASSGNFTINGSEYLSREPIVSSDAPIDYWIPIGHIPNCSKLIFEFRFEQLSYRADYFECGAYAIVNNSPTLLGRKQSYNSERPTDFVTYEVDLSQDYPVDYIRISADLGVVNYNNIKLISTAPAHGQGIVTLDIPANGANLTFTSAELGAVISKFIDSDAVIDMESEPQEQMFEFLWQFISWDNAQGVMLGSVERGIAYENIASSAIAGDLIEQDVNTYSVTAKENIKARVGTANSLNTYTDFAKNAVLSSSFSGYNRLIISKTLNNALPFEVGFVWASQQGGGARGGQKCILKRNGDFVPHDGTSDLTQGEFITFNATVNYMYINISSFSGTIKYQSNNGSLVEVSGSSGLSMNLPNGLSVFFCYPD